MFKSIRKHSYLRNRAKSKAKPGHNKSRLVRIIVIFSLTFMLLNGIIITKRAIVAYDESITQGKTYAERLTHTIADHIRLTFIAADLALKRAAERHYFNALFGNKLVTDMQNNFVKWVGETPQISAMIMTDENGVIQAIHNRQNFNTWMRRGTSVRKQDFFTEHRQSDNPDLLYIGWQNSWDEGHGGFIIMSRRIEKINGSFGGIVLVAVDSDYVVNFFKSVETSVNTGMILLHDMEGQPLISLTENSDLEKVISESIKTSGVGEDKQHDTVILSKGNIDGLTNIISSEYIPNLHMILSVAIAGEDVLSEWYGERLDDVIFLAVFLLFVFVISFFAVAVAKQMQQVRMSERGALLASQAKSEFLANMSHELRTPLNAIIGFSEMLEAGYFGEMNQKQKERIKDVHFCGSHLLELINDILEFSKGEAGKSELHEEKVSMQKMIAETTRMFAEKSKKQGIRIITSVAENLPPITADSRKIRQILLNLISNSMKFTNEHGTIDVSGSLDEKGNLFFAVADTGTGMDEKDIPKALSAFGQVHNDPAKGGTGLGLPLCKMFAEMHGGNLKLQSIKGVGTKVTITLPASRVIKSQERDMPEESNNKGYTLIELSMIIVILGLLTASIIVGFAMVKQAKDRAVIAEVTNFKTAISAFKLEYNYLPGDFPQALNYWPGCQAGTSPVKPCNGNGDGSVTPWNSEGIQLWQHLSLAGLIKGGYTAQTPTDVMTINVTVPGSKISNDAGYRVGGGADPGNIKPDTATQRIWLAAYDTPPDDRLDSPVLTPKDAEYIDKKMDDGMIKQGWVQSESIDWNVYDCHSIWSTNATYVFATKTPSCLMYFYF